MKDTDPKPYLVLHEGEAELCRGFCPCDNRTIEVYCTGGEYLVSVTVACDMCKKPVECYPWFISAL